MGAGNGLQVDIFASTSNGHINDQNVFNVNTWYHIAFTYDKDAVGRNLKGYIDGVEIAYDSEIQPVGTIDQHVVTTYIGRRASVGNPDYFDGDIDEVAIFDRVLSLAEINDIMDNGLAGAVVADNSQLIMII